jgi:hypothetical protein
MPWRVSLSPAGPHGHIARCRVIYSAWAPEPASHPKLRSLLVRPLSKRAGLTPLGRLLWSRKELGRLLDPRPEPTLMLAPQEGLASATARSRSCLVDPLIKGERSCDFSRNPLKNV